MPAGRPLADIKVNRSGSHCTAQAPVTAKNLWPGWQTALEGGDRGIELAELAPATGSLHADARQRAVVGEAIRAIGRSSYLVVGGVQGPSTLAGVTQPGKCPPADPQHQRLQAGSLHDFTEYCLGQAALGEISDVVALAVHRVGGDHRVPQVADLVEQRTEAGDLARKCSVGGRVDMDPGRS